MISAQCAAAGIFADVDPVRAADALAAAKFRNAGQVCVAPSRFFVHEAIHAPFVERMAEIAGALRVGPGNGTETDMGPLANGRQRDSIARGIEDALARGASLVTGGKRVGDHGNGYRPTVLTDVPDDADIMQIEPFGPVVPITKFTGMEEFVLRANALSYGLAATVFTGNLAIARWTASNLEVGMVGINDTAFGLPETPVCGVKDSGYGHEGGSEGLGDHLVTKFVNELF